MPPLWKNTLRHFKAGKEFPMEYLIPPLILNQWSSEHEQARAYFNALPEDKQLELLRRGAGEESLDQEIEHLKMRE